MIFGRHELYLYFETRAYSLHYEKFADGTVKKLDVPYELPDGWEWAKLGSYMDVRDGTHDTPKYFDSGIPFVTSKNLGDGKIDFKNVNYISDEDSQKFNQRSRVEAGDILMAMIGTIGKPVVAPKVEFEYSIKNVALFKRLTIEQNSKFIRDYLQYSEKRLRKCASGGNQKFLSLKKLKEILIPIPPSSEQKQIVSVLSDYLSLVECIDSDQNALQQLASQLKQKVLDIAMQGKLVPQDPNDEPASVLLEKIRAEKQRLYEEGKIKKKDLVETEIVKDGDNAYYRKIPKSWEFVVLNQVALNYDSHRKAVSASERRERNSRKKADDLYPYFGATGQAGWIDDYLLDEITILIGEDGAPFLDKLASKAYIVKGKYWVNNHAHVIKPLINATYLMDFFNSFDYTGFVNGTTRLKLTQTKLYSIPIPLAPENEQYRITLAINKMNQQLQKLI